MKKILVTGGSGFIGTNLVNFLLSKKYIVHNIDKFSNVSTPEKFKININKKNYNFKKIDLIKYNQVFKIISNFKPNFIINLAAESHVDRSIDTPINFIKNNINSSLHLLEITRKLLKKQQIKFIHVSTDEVYGSINYSSSLEKDQYNPRSPYSSSKASTDHIAMSYYYTYNLPLSLVNICNNYGPYQFIEKFIPNTINNLLLNRKIPIYGNGKNIREWIFVEDCCEAIFNVLSNFNSGKKYNIGSGIRSSNINIVKYIIEIFNEDKKYNINFNDVVEFVKDRPGHDFRYAINSNLFRKEMKWKSKISLKEGLRKTIKWYINNKEWLQHSRNQFKGKRQGLSD